MSAMPRPLPHLVRETNRHGSTVYYVRVGHGPRIRLRAAYGTPEFVEQYQAAIAGDKPRVGAGKAPRGSLEWLWNLYRQARAWTELSPATRRQRENIMRPVLAASGTQPVARINKASVEAGVKKRQSTPTQAKHFVTSLRGMFEWAISSDLATVDPTRGIGFKTTGKKAKAAGFPVWTEEDLDRFEKRWPVGTRERVAFDIFKFTGLRRGDAARLGRPHVRNGEIAIQTEKTGEWVYQKICPELQATLDAGPTGDLTFIATIYGRPRKKEALGNWFGEACRAAGVRKSAHGIRKAAATRAADNGATEAELDAMFGWRGGQMAALYTRSANRRRLSLGATDKLTGTGTQNPAPDQKVRDAG